MPPALPGENVTLTADKTGGRPVSRQKLAARGESPAAFDRRCIPAAYVAPRSHTAGIFPRRALPAKRITGLGATLDLRHGLLDDAVKEIFSCREPPAVLGGNPNAPL